MIEILRFGLAAGVDDKGFLAADRRVQSEFAYQQAGLLRRTTARHQSGSWIVITVWRSAADADRSVERWTEHPVVADFMALLDPATATTERYTPLP